MQNYTEVETFWYLNLNLRKKVRKEKNASFEKSTIVWKILKIHWKIVMMEDALRNAFDDKQ